MINFVKVVGILLSLGISNVAMAHAHLEEAKPPINAILKIVPTRIVLKFSETLEVALCKIEVKNIETGKVVSDGTHAMDGEQSTIETSLGPIAEKTAKFVVSWKVVSTDSHKMSGNYEFTLDAK